MKTVKNFLASRKIISTLLGLAILVVSDTVLGVSETCLYLVAGVIGLQLFGITVKDLAIWLPTARPVIDEARREE